MDVSGQLHISAASPPGERTSGSHWRGWWIGSRISLDAVDKRKILNSSCPGRSLVVIPIERSPPLEKLGGISYFGVQQVACVFHAKRLFLSSQDSIIEPFLSQFNPPHILTAHPVSSRSILILSSLLYIMTTDFWGYATGISYEEYSVLGCDVTRVPMFRMKCCLHLQDRKWRQYLISKKVCTCLPYYTVSHVRCE
jgi:hypothetical protein